MTAESLWEEAYNGVVEITEKHPFLVAMVDGSLSMINFKYYVVQDALYLKDFAESLRLLSEKPDATPEESVRVKKYEREVREAELELHSGFFKEWDIKFDDGGDSDDPDQQQMPNCLLYTSYMLRVVTTRPFAEGLAVLTPCFWVYMHVGKCMLKLRRELGDTVDRPPPFDAWIDTYGGDDFEALVMDCVDLLDTACKRATADKDGASLKAMKKHFIMSCKLEHMFWDQAQTLQRWPAVLGGCDCNAYASGGGSSHHSDYERYDSLS